MQKNELRTKKIDTRFTEAEYLVIEEMEKTLGLSKTELVRTRMLNDASHMVVNARELILELDKIGKELRMSGNNINQLARHANILRNRGLLGPVIFERFNSLFALYLENQKLLDIALRKTSKMLAR